MNPKILLIEPPATGKYSNLRSKGTSGESKIHLVWQPIDLMVISGFLNKNNIENRILDANANKFGLKQVEQAIRQYNPTHVVISTSTPTIYLDTDVARIAKNISKDIVTMIFGCHVMALPEDTLKLKKELDIAIFQEPELPLLSIIKNKNFAEVKGIAYRAGSKIIRNPSGPLLQNLDELGFPNHQAMDLTKYRDPFMKQKPMSITMFTRGCINKCSFCLAPLYGAYRSRSPDHIMKEMDIIQSLGIKELRFFDNGVNYDEKWGNEVYDRMRGYGLSWVCNARADKMTENLVVRMKKAGCHTVSFGVESSNADILKRCGKNLDLNVLKTAVRNCRKHKLDVICYFVMGLPGETKKTINETIKFVKKLNPDAATFNVATPFPGTPMYDYLKKNGWIKTDDFSKYDAMSFPVFDYPNLSGKEIIEGAMMAYRKFYLRPSYILRKLLKTRTKTEFMANIKNFTSFMNNFVIRKYYKPESFKKESLE